MGETLFRILPLPSHSPQNAPGFSALMPSRFRIGSEDDFIVIYFLCFQ
jgi:hypothetical protein